jgi:hypothetical protein
MNEVDLVEGFVVRWLGGDIRPCIEGLLLLSQYLATPPTARELENEPFVKISGETMQEKLRHWNAFSLHVDMCERCGPPRTGEPAEGKLIPFPES